MRSRGNVRVEATADKPDNEDVFVNRISQIDADANVELQEFGTILCSAQRTGLGPNFKSDLGNQLQITGKIIVVNVKWNLNV